MCKLCIKNRRESTMMRDNEVHRIYDEIIDNLGELASAVSKSYL